jgi:phage tail-like protein
MEGDRSLSLLADPDQWARCRHEHTAPLRDGGVQLTWDEDIAGAAGPAADCPTPDPPPTPRGLADPAGLAFDRWCRAYRSHPREGRVSVHLRGRPADDGGEDRDAACGATFACPLGVGVDAAQRLYVAESGSGRVSVADLWSQRLLRRVPVHSPAHRARRPVDLATHCCRAYVLLQRPAGIVVVQGRRGPLPGPRLHRPRCRGAMEPCRLAVRPDGTLLVLWRRRDDAAALVATVDGVVLREVAGGTDLDVAPDGLLVVAREPDRPFCRFQPDGDGWLELEPLAAVGYDGGAVAVAPDGRIAFTTEDGIGWTAGLAVRRRSAGRVVTYRLDGGSYRMRWGRVFLDACIPPGTDVRLRFVGSDDDEVVDPVEWQQAERSTATVRHPERTPPLPSSQELEAAAERVAQPLFRRPTGRERPWAQIAAADRFETYEAPVVGARGRYLWVVLDLAGTVVATPRIRAMRVERPGHRLLSHLPRSWSRDDGDADFLQRLLAPAEGMVHELDERAAQRALLVDPSTTPQEALGWLASFAGLVLDRRWSEAARRTLVAEAYRLFRRRGTLATLRRIIEIYLGYEPAIVEQWQLRGIPGGILGTTAASRAAPVVGGGMRAGGTLGGVAVGGTAPGEDGYTTSAHRFSVLIPADLSSEQLDVVRSILEAHRPAHTLYEICELGFGMRVGRHLHLRLTSVVGPEVGFGPAVVGQVAVGGDGVVGVPALGARLGDSSVTGAVRVG